MTRVKICGVTTLDTALQCARAGADMLGLNFYSPSPRSLTPNTARLIVEGLRSVLDEGCPILVGVFVNADAAEIAQVLDQVGLDVAQLSGDESPATLAALKGRGIKAIRPQSREQALVLADQYAPYSTDDPRLPSLIVDAYHQQLYGGTGESTSTEVAVAAIDRVPRLMLAGGLKPENVAERVAAIRPWGVDVASGVEDGKPGIKDPGRVHQFISRARGGYDPT